MKIDKNTTFWFVTDPSFSEVEVELGDVVSKGNLDYLYNVMIGGYYHLNRHGSGPRKPSDENLTIYDNQADAEKDGKVRMEKHNKKLAKADKLLTAAVNLLVAGEDDLAQDVLDLVDEPMPEAPELDQPKVVEPEETTEISDEVTCRELLNVPSLKKLLDSVIKHVEENPNSYNKAEELLDMLTKQVRRFFVSDTKVSAYTNIDENEDENDNNDEKELDPDSNEALVESLINGNWSYVKGKIKKKTQEEFVEFIESYLELSGENVSRVFEKMKKLVS